MQGNIKLFDLLIISFAIGNGIGWVRIFGKGIHYKNTSKYRLLYSERNGYGLRIKIGKYIFKYLK